MRQCGRCSNFMNWSLRQGKPYVCDNCGWCVDDAKPSPGFRNGGQVPATGGEKSHQQIIDEQAALIRQQQAVIDRLPKTKDGVVITPGMDVWCIRTARWKWIGERGTASYRGVEDYTEYPDGVGCSVAHIVSLGSDIQRFGVLRHARSFTEMSKPEWCYSTQEAADADKATRSAGGKP